MALSDIIIDNIIRVQPIIHSNIQTVPTPHFSSTANPTHMPTYPLFYKPPPIPTPTNPRLFFAFSLSSSAIHQQFPFITILPFFSSFGI